MRKETGGEERVIIVGASWRGGRDPASLFLAFVRFGLEGASRVLTVQAWRRTMTPLEAFFPFRGS